MHTREERREELCSEICDFRDRLLKKFGEEEVYTSLLWISSLIFLSSSTNLSEGKKEAFRAVKASYKEELDRRNKEILLKSKASMDCPIEKYNKIHNNLYLLSKTRK
tara:strand:+ start:277 stop:597 length:321 start_codon:yes stop_codon:yes gene_type:complete